MGFVIANKDFKGAGELGKLFYDGSDVVVSGFDIIALKTNALGNKRQNMIDNVLENTQSNSAPYIVSTDDFYAALCYKSDSELLTVQTDIIAYESAFIYCSGDLFIISDSILKIVEILQFYHIPVGLREEKIRKFIYLGNYFTPETIFSDISILQPSTNYFLNTSTLELKSSEYDDLSFSGKIKDADEAATRLYAVLDEVFKSNYLKDLKYGIGISGGLDSRVGAYFAKKNGYKIFPYFLGRKRNSLGIITNDAKRSSEVTDELGLKGVRFYHTDLIPYSKKLENDSVSSPTGSPNANQNIGYDWPDFDVMIHGMIGGELFGGVDFLTEKNFSCSPEELSESIISTLNLFPQYKVRYSLLGKIKTKLPVLKDRYEFSDEDKNRIVSEKLRIELQSELSDWIGQQKARGLSNINIAMKFFYYNYARNVRTGYYSTLEENIASFGTYFNPRVITEVRNWGDELFLNRIVQKALIKKCGNLSSIRDQTTAASIMEGSQAGWAKKLGYVLERVFRGSGMYYLNYNENEFASQLKELKQQEIIKMFDCDYIKLSAAKADICHLIMKLAWIEKHYNLLIIHENCL